MQIDKINGMLQIEAKAINEKTIEAMYDDLILLPNLMANPRFFGPDFDELGVAPWEK